MYESILEKLRKSKFRSSFYLEENDFKLIRKNGLDKIREHTFNLLKDRIRIKSERDGKQTPLKGHPTFIGQHATATCCRECMKKWHGVPENKELNDSEIDYFVGLIMAWIAKELKTYSLH